MTTKEQMNYVSEFEKYTLDHGLTVVQLVEQVRLLQGNIEYYMDKEEKLDSFDKEQFLYLELQTEALNNVLRNMLALNR